MRLAHIILVQLSSGNATPGGCFIDARHNQVGIAPNSLKLGLRSIKSDYYLLQVEFEYSGVMLRLKDLPVLMKMAKGHGSYDCMLVRSLSAACFKFEATAIMPIQS